MRQKKVRLSPKNINYKACQKSPDECVARKYSSELIKAKKSNIFHQLSRVPPEQFSTLYYWALPCRICQCPRGDKVICDRGLIYCFSGFLRLAVMPKNLNTWRKSFIRSCRNFVPRDDVADKFAAGASACLAVVTFQLCYFSPPVTSGSANYCFTFFSDYMNYHVAGHDVIKAHNLMTPPR